MRQPGIRSPIMSPVIDFAIRERRDFSSTSRRNIGGKKEMPVSAGREFISIYVDILYSLGIDTSRLERRRLRAVQIVELHTQSDSCTAGGPPDAIETCSESSGLQYLGDGYWQFTWKRPRPYRQLAHHVCRIRWIFPITTCHIPVQAIVQSL